MQNDKTLRHESQRVTSELLRREARKALLEYGCEAPELIISHGKQTSSPHDNGSGAIRAGEPVMLDFFARSMESGYWFDMTRTVVKGKPRSGYAKLWRAVLGAQKAGLALVRAGMPVKRIHREIEEHFRRAGYKTTDTEGFTHSTGHGVGLQIHEEPAISSRSGERLRAGMVITIEPGLYYKALGGARIEDTVLVTTTGYKDLTRLPKVLYEPDAV